MTRHYPRLLLVLLIALLSTTTGVNAQDAPMTTLLLNVPPWYMNDFDQDYFADFYSANPNVRVEVHYDENAMWRPLSPSSHSLDEHLAVVSPHAASFDVIWVRDLYSALTPEAVHAGLFVDLLPLASADAVFHPSDLYPSAWRAFQWEGGLWALPYLTIPLVVAYDAVQFDAVGLSYPDETWNLERFIEAGRALTTLSQSGEFTRPGFFGTFLPLIRHEYDSPFFDDSSGQIVPNFATPAMAEIVTQAVEGALDIHPPGPFNNERPPMLWTSIERLSEEWQTFTEQTLTPVLMPFNYVEVEGFAVSAESSRPELAYQLACYLMLHPTLFHYDVRAFPAGPSLTIESSQLPPILPDNLHPIIETVLETGWSASDAVLYPYIEEVANAMWRSDRGDALVALTIAQQTAADNLFSAASR